MKNMKDFKKIIIWILIVFSLGSCNKDYANVSEYISYVRNPINGLQKEKVIGNISLALQYKPIDYMVLNETRGKIDGRFEKRKKELSGLQHYTLKLALSSHQGDITEYKVSDEKGYQDRLYYLSYGMQEDIKMVQGTDTLKCSLYHFERSFDSSPYRTFVLAFEEHQAEGDRILIWDSKEMGLGTLKLGIKEKDIKSIPKLKI